MSGDTETKFEHDPKNIPDHIFTWGARVFTPRWCATPTHWTSRFVDYLWVDCPCCLFFRGVVVGLVAALSTVAIVGAFIGWLS